MRDKIQFVGAEWWEQAIALAQIISTRDQCRTGWVQLCESRGWFRNVNRWAVSRKSPPLCQFHS
jgi:hypothetical protein